MQVQILTKNALTNFKDCLIIKTRKILLEAIFSTKYENKSVLF